ncbi:hypothetical protein M9Y10_014267 [Tritrichomonas musculus]|uniref:Uncharacterized protein n=1 Tax=Tritrichomonas musculus TaxID=1915356 RepID=A0ABR2KZ15_9EUKA
MNVEDRQFPQTSSKFFAKNSQSGFKWRLFLFSCIFKSCFCTKVVSNFVYLLFDFVIAAFSSYYSLGAATIPLDDVDTLNIFPDSKTLTFITPKLFPTTYILVIIFAFFILFFINFLLCFFNISYISMFSKIFNPQIHMIFYPLVSGTIGYCIYYITLNDIKSDIQFSFCLLDILLYLLYSFLLSLLVFIDTSSIIQPNPLFSVWIGSCSPLYPILTAIISILQFQNQRFSHTNRIIILGFLIIIPFGVCIYFICRQPFVVLMINEIFAVKYIFMSYCAIFTLVAIEVGDDIHFMSSTLSFVIVLTIISFFIIHILICKIRKSSEKILSQISDSESLTVDALETIFESIPQEVKFQNIIKIGLQSSYLIVSNENFIRFCLEKFPNSDFLLCFVIDLYTSIWGVDSDTYKFFLHLCSVDLYSFTAEMHLYQSAFCYMQASQVMSPLISRELETYRMSFLSLCQSHRRFWISCLEDNGRNTKKFESARSEVLSLFRKNYSHLKRLCKYYRFCPSILYERSIFEADFRHKYDVSSKYFHLADRLSRDPKSYISKMLFQPCSIFFSGMSPFTSTNMLKKKGSFREKFNINEKPMSMKDDGYVFISCSDHNDRAQKIVAQLVTYDSYISKICERPVMIQKNQLQTEFKFFNSHIWFLRSLIVFVILMYVVCVFLIHHCNSIFSHGKVVYNHVLEEINATLKFRKNIISYQYNIMLLVDIINLTYDGVIKGGAPGWNHSESWLKFFSFAMKYLMQTEKSLLNYKYVVDMFNQTFPTSELSEIYDYSDFQILFSRLHIMFDTLSHTNQSLTEYIESFPLILEQYIPNIISTSELIYFLIVKYFDDYIHSMYLRNRGYIISSFVIAFLVPFIAFWIQHSSVNYIFTKVSSIIKTIQQPELKNIAEMFKNTLKSEEHQKVESSWYRFINPVKIIFPAFFLLLIHPIVVACFLGFRNCEVKYKTKLFEYIPFSSSSRFVFYSESWIMFRMYDQMVSSTVTTRSYASEFETSTIHYLFGSDPFNINTINDLDSIYYDVDYYIQCTFFDYADGLFILISMIIVIFSIIFLCYYIYLITISEKVASSGRYILYFLPPIAVNSNPVFQALIRGYHLSLNEVNTFSEELKKIPKFKGVFCTYFYNENNEIVDYYGDKDMVMPFLPKTIDEIVTFYEEKAGVHPSMGIREFFTAKNVSNMLRMTIEDDRDISVSFISPDQIFFRPELSNEEMIKREKLYRYVNGLPEDAFPKKRTPIQNGFLFAITGLNLEDHKKLIQLARNQSDFFLFDTRNESLFGAIASTVPQSAHLALLFIKNAPVDSNAIISYGGPMTFFDMPRGQFSKSRCVSEVYDVVYFLSTFCERGSLYFTKEFIAQLEPKKKNNNENNSNDNNDNSNDNDNNNSILNDEKKNDDFGFDLNFESVKMANNRDLLYTKIDFESIQDLIDNSDVKKVELPPSPQLKATPSAVNPGQRFSRFQKNPGIPGPFPNKIQAQLSGQIAPKISPLLQNPK